MDAARKTRRQLDMTKPSLLPLVAALPATVPFVGPETQERAMGKPYRARLGANESAFGPSPAVQQAMVECARGDVWKYADPENYDLRAALSAHLGLGLDQIVIGEGIDGLLGTIVRQYVGLGTPVVTSLGAYPTFNYHVAIAGGALHAVPFVDDHESLDGLLEAARMTKAAIVYLSNPDNPMGTWWSAADIQRFAAALPPETLLILDEAYGETAPDDALPPLDWCPDNVIRTRTFSKAYGLAGLRCGYAFGAAHLIAPFEKVRSHFGVNIMAQRAGVAALGDQAYLTEIVETIAQARERVSAIARANGLKPIASATNFVTIDCGFDGAYALAVLQKLLAAGVFVRKPMAPHLDRCIRISVAPNDELDIFEHVLPTVL